MTHRNGRFGRKYNRSGIGDPRGHWGTGVPSSAGFAPEQPVVLEGEGIVFAGQTDCPDGKIWNKERQQCEYPDLRDPFKSNNQTGDSGLKLSRSGAPKTRLKHRLLRRRR